MSLGIVVVLLYVDCYELSCIQSKIFQTVQLVLLILHLNVIFVCVFHSVLNKVKN